MRTVIFTSTVLLLATSLLTGCPNSRVRTADARPPLPDGGADTGSPDDGAVADVDTGPPTAPRADDLDLLFLVDNSNSMTEEQSSFASALPSLFRELSGLYGSIQVGVVTTDMGTGGFPIPTCNEPDFGDNGVLRTAGADVPGCMARYPSFLEYAPVTGDSDAFAYDVGCVAAAGTGGCGFEQPLEAILKAVTPASQGPSGRFDGTFSMGTMGHGDDANLGFLRPDADLAIVVLTDEEDCSNLDPQMFDPRSTVYTEELNLRCFAYPGALQPVGRYADGLLASRRAERLHVLVIAGVPVDAVGSDFEAILAHPDMTAALDPADPSRLAYSCNVTGRGLAFPPRRIVEVGQQLDAAGAAVSIQSICQGDFSSSVDALVSILR